MSMPEQDQLQPDYTVIEKHLELLFGEEMYGRIEIAWTDPARGGNLCQARTFGVDQLQEATQLAHDVNQVPGQSVYVGMALRDEDTPPVGRCRDDDVLETRWLWVDLDDAGAAEEAREKLSTYVMPNISVVTGR